MNQERSNTYLKGLTNEISEAIDLLKPKPHPLQLLPVDLWQSAVNSGDVALFRYEAREDLRKAYFAIMKCNYQFTRIKELEKNSGLKRIHLKKGSGFQRLGVQKQTKLIT